jgi:hypothetical protein
MHKEKAITLVHNIRVDDCIADEIEELNNVYGIFTLSSCCGHGSTGYIIVAVSDMEEMMSLGYNNIALNYLDNDIEIEGDRIVMMAFKPKSECNCDK